MYALVIEEFFSEKTAVYEGNDNIYWLMAEKYKIEEALKDYLNKNKKFNLGMYSRRIIRT